MKINNRNQLEASTVLLIFWLFDVSIVVVGAKDCYYYYYCSDIHQTLATVIKNNHYYGSSCSNKSGDGRSEVQSHGNRGPHLAQDPGHSTKYDRSVRSLAYVWLHM